MFVLEIAMGQYTSQGAVSCWNYFCPLFKGWLICFAQINATRCIFPQLN